MGWAGWGLPFVTLTVAQLRYQLRMSGQPPVKCNVYVGGWVSRAWSLNSHHYHKRLSVPVPALLLWINSTRTEPDRL